LNQGPILNKYSVMAEWPKLAHDQDFDRRNRCCSISVPRAQDFLKRITPLLLPILRPTPALAPWPNLFLVLGDPKKIIQALDRLRALKTFDSSDAVNTKTSPQLPKYVSAAFGSLELPWNPATFAPYTARHLLPQVQTPKTRPTSFPRPNPRS
jgi:hypothetical protein